MKKYLIFGLICLFACYGCDNFKTDTHSYVNQYIYRNRSSRVITVKSYSLRIINGEVISTKDSVFVIPIEGKHQTDFHYGLDGARGPLNWGYFGSQNQDSTIVSNGEKQIVYRYRNQGKIYFIYYYTLVSQKGRTSTYEYTFTDADFEDAEPITP